jgi:hypothetical protein
MTVTKQPEQENALVHYDSAALAVARSVDEVKDIRDKSVAMAAYARQAKNRTLEADAAEIRERAERRLGEMIKAQGQAGLLSPGTRHQGFGPGPRIRFRAERAHPPSRRS